jgi:hypothetical protein
MCRCSLHAFLALPYRTPACMLTASQCCPGAGVSLVLACTKWDALKDTAEPEGLRVLGAALRWLAHSNTAHLVYLEGLQPRATGGWTTLWPAPCIHFARRGLRPLYRIHSMLA